MPSFELGNTAALEYVVVWLSIEQFPSFLPEVRPSDATRVAAIAERKARRSPSLSQVGSRLRGRKVIAALLPIKEVGRTRYVRPLMQAPEQGPPLRTSSAAKMLVCIQVPTLTTS